MESQILQRDHPKTFLPVFGQHIGSPSDSFWSRLEFPLRQLLLPSSCPGKKPRSFFLLRSPLCFPSHASCPRKMCCSPQPSLPSSVVGFTPLAYEREYLSDHSFIRAKPDRKFSIRYR